jgi:hypothetical protein
VPFQLAPLDVSLIRDGDPEAIFEAISSLYSGVTEAFATIDRHPWIWQDVPFAAGDFTASAGTWTVAAADVDLYRYIFVERAVILSFRLQNTTTGSGMGTELYIPMPQNLSAKSAHQTGFVQADGSITEVGYISTRAGANATTLALHRSDASSWPSSVTDNLDVRGMIVVEV